MTYHNHHRFRRTVRVLFGAPPIGFGLLSLLIALAAIAMAWSTAP